LFSEEVIPTAAKDFPFPSIKPKPRPVMALDWFGLQCITQSKLLGLPVVLRSIPSAHKALRLACIPVYSYSFRLSLAHSTRFRGSFNKVALQPHVKRQVAVVPRRPVFNKSIPGGRFKF